MNLTPADIDRIVAEVVRRLRALVASSLPPATGQAGSLTYVTSQKPEARNSLNLTDKVITLATIKGRLEGITTVVVGERAIVTHAVKDELRDKKITWQRSTKARS